MRAVWSGKLKRFVLQARDFLHVRCRASGPAKIGPHRILCKHHQFLFFFFIDHGEWSSPFGFANKQPDPKALNWLRWPTWPCFSHNRLLFRTQSRGDTTRQDNSIRLCLVFWFARRPPMPRPPIYLFISFFLSLHRELIWKQHTNSRLWKSTTFSLIHTHTHCLLGSHKPQCTCTHTHTGCIYSPPPHFGRWHCAGFH